MSLEDSLSTVEEQLKEVQSALLATDPLTLEKAATQLRAVAAGLAGALEAGPARATWPEGTARRIEAIGSQLAFQRDQLARLLALTERQAASLLPPVAGVATYGTDGMGSKAATGARIYRAPS